MQTSWWKHHDVFFMAQKSPQLDRISAVGRLYDRPRFHRKRVAAWLTLLAISGSATVFGPDLLRAGMESAPPASVDAELARLSHFLRTSHRTLAIRQRGESPFLELVLWVRDEEDPGQMNAEEVAILTHCRARSEISLHRLEGSRLGSGAVLPDEFWSTPGFYDHWRARVDVRREVWADGISDLGVQIAEASTKGVMTLTIELDSRLQNADAQSRGTVRVRTLSDSIASQE